MRWRLSLAAFLIARAGQAHPLPENLAGRRSIRGVTVDEARESDALKQMRRFEEEAFAAHHERYVEPRRADKKSDGESDGEADGQAGGSDGNNAPDNSWIAALEVPDLPVRWDPRVIRFLEFYRNDKRGRSIMSSWLKRQGRYRAMLERALERHRLPKSLLYVVMIESGYDPLDRSSVGASGLWQLMPEGGKIYGLREDHWVDERNDPEKATEATMRYLEDLHARFGSWHLALAAFNAGYGAVIHAVQKYNTNDYWELCRHEDGLPWETVLYVPKILAAAIVGENRAAFGYGELVADAELRPDRVELAASTTVPTLARAAGVSVDATAALNPELRRGRTPPPTVDAGQGSQGSWTVKLPAGTATRFLSTINKERDKTGTHVVKFGERLEGIARAYGTSVKELKRMNGIRDLAEVRPNLTLVVPARSGAPVDAHVEGGGDGGPGSDGDGEPAIVAVPDKEAEVPGKKRVFYRTVPGDDVGEVAGFFKVGKADLARWNSLDLDAKLIANMVLQVWVSPSFDAGPAALDPKRVRLVTVGSEEFLDLVESRHGRRRVAYVCRAGDTFKKVCERFGLTEGDLERINRLSHTTELAPGQKLVVYVKQSDAPGVAGQASAIAPTEAVAAQAGKDPLPTLPSLSTDRADEPGNDAPHDAASDVARDFMGPPYERMGPPRELMNRQDEFVGPPWERDAARSEDPGVDLPVEAAAPDAARPEDAKTPAPLPRPPIAEERGPGEGDGARTTAEGGDGHGGSQ